VNARRNLFTKIVSLFKGSWSSPFFASANSNSRLHYMKIWPQVGETAPLTRGVGGIWPQTVISTKWTKWTHGEIPLQKIVSLLWRELFSPPRPAILRGYGAGIVGFMNKLSFRLSERSERTEKSNFNIIVSLS